MGQVPGHPAPNSSTDLGQDPNKPPEFSPGTGYMWQLQPTYDTITGSFLGYQWRPVRDPSYSPSSGDSTASAANAAQRNAIDQAHYERSDAEQAIRDAADALYQRGQLGTSLYGQQAQSGQNLLDTVVNLLKDPNAGPLGLSAYAKYGAGAQNIAQGTGGQGIANPNASLLDRLLGSLSGAVGPNTEFSAVNNGAATTDYPKADPNKAPMMTPESAAQAPDNRQALVDAWGAFNPGKTLGVDEGVKYPVPGALAGAHFTLPGYADGGGVTVGGEPHFIVDSQGNRVADITEDGKPETVKPAPGGVEVVPEDPARKAAYENAKASGQLLGKLIGEVLYPQTKPQPAAAAAAPAAPPQLATGGTALFPNIPGSQVSPSEIPTAGGPATEPSIGDYFHPSNDQPLPTEATAPDFNTRLHGYAKLLGAALSKSASAVPAEAKQALNAGAAPSQLLSAQALSTLNPSVRSDYFALLQQMGLGSPEDIQYQIQQGRPAVMSGPAGGGKIGG